MGWIPRGNSSPRIHETTHQGEPKSTHGHTTASGYGLWVVYLSSGPWAEITTGSSCTWLGRSSKLRTLTCGIGSWQTLKRHSTWSPPDSFPLEWTQQLLQRKQ